MKHIIIVIILIVNVGTILSQDTLHLFNCHSMAIEGHPSYREKNLYLRSKEIKVDNLGTNWYPSLDLNGSYSWQNEVVSLPFDESIPGLVIPEVPHSNTKITMDIRQTLYDGGLTRAGKDLEEMNMQVNQQQVDVSLNNIKDQVNLVFFHILLLQEQEKTISLKLKILEGNRNRIEAGVNHEILGITELRLIQAEILRAEQQLAEIRISNASALKMLGKLIYSSIPENTVLALPDVILENGEEGLRSENILFDLQLKQLDASMKLVSRNRQPKAYVFGQLGYGNPALDFFRDEFRGYYIVGAGLQWNIWDWNKTGREKEDLLVRQEIIRLREAAFDEGISVQQEEISAEIKKFEEAVQRDLEIVKLRSEITSVAASQHDNGVITTSEYIRELNAENESRILLNIHEIKLEQAKIKYLTSKGII